MKISVSGCNGCTFKDVNVKVDSSRYVELFCHVMINHITCDSRANVFFCRLKSGAEAKNTDGFDIGSSSDVSIYNSVISNDDDCVAVNGGSSGVYNLHITDILNMFSSMCSD
jgi:polygalacturonase